MRQAGLVGLRKGFERGLRPGKQAGTMGQPLMLRRQRIPLAVLRCELLQFGDLVGQLRPFRLAIRKLFLGFRHQRIEPLPVPPGLGAGIGELARAGMRIEKRALRRRPQQRLVLVLAMNVEQEFARFPQLGQRRGMPVHEAP
jgi:hypothetical protein